MLIYAANAPGHVMCKLSAGFLPVWSRIWWVYLCTCLWVHSPFFEEIEEDGKQNGELLFFSILMLWLCQIKKKSESIAMTLHMYYYYLYFSF